MPLNKFRELAQTIASCKEPEIEVRPELLDLLREVITLRQAATVFYRNNSSSNQLFQQNDQGHYYVIQVLQDVLAILEPLTKTERVNRPNAATTNADELTQISNIFDALEVEDLEDLPEPVIHLEIAKGSNARRSNHKSKSRPKQSKDRFELGSSREELFFLLFCFFRDLHDVQDYLQEVWAGYRDGRTTLAAAAATTDLAFEVVKRKEEELLDSEWIDSTDGVQQTIKDALANMQKTRTDTAVPLYWKFEKDGALLNHGYIGEILFQYMNDMNGKKMGFEGKIDEAVQDRMYRIGDWLYTPAYIVLEVGEALTGGSEALGGAPLPVTPSFVGTNSAEAVKSLKQFEKGFKMLIPIIMDLYKIRAAGLDEDIKMDVWSQAICELADCFKEDTKTRLGSRSNLQIRNTIPAWLAFATAVYVDIRTILGSGVKRAFHDLRRESNKASKTINQMVQWCRHHREQAWTKQHYEMMEHVQEVLTDYVHEDPMIKFNERWEYPTDGEAQTPPHFLMRHHPLWAGVVVLWLQLTMWDATMEMTNIYTGTWNAMQLYTLALTKESFDWPDMEYLIDLHGPEHLFFGGRSTTAPECARKYMLSMGMSAQMSAKGGRHNNRHISKRPMRDATRQLRPHVILSDLLNWRYAFRMRQGPKEGPQTTLPALQLLLEFQQRSPDGSLVSKDEHSAYLVPLLSLVQKAVAADAKHLAFDYYAMHLRCWALLQRIETDIGDDVASVVGEGLLGTDPTAVKLIPGLIFQMVSSLSEAGRRNMEGHPMTQMVSKAQEDVKIVATEEGSIGLDAVTQTLATHVQEAETGAYSADSDDEDDNTSVNEDEMATISAMIDMAPKRLVTDDQARQAYKYAKKTPINKMPSQQQRYLKWVQANGGDLSKGAMGIAQAEHNLLQRLTDEQVKMFYATTDLEEMMDLVDGFDKEAAGKVTDVTDAKKKRNNKNKNKNRKLKQKAVKASGTTDDEDSHAETPGDSIVASVGRGVTSVLGSLFGGRSENSSSAGAQESTLRWTTGSALPSMAEYNEAKRQGKMIIDGVEYERW